MNKNDKIKQTSDNTRRHYRKSTERDSIVPRVTEVDMKTQKERNIQNILIGVKDDNNQTD